MSSMQGLTPVAVTIAKKRQQELAKSKKDTRGGVWSKESTSSLQSSSVPLSSSDTTKTKTKTVKKKSNSFRIFLEGATIYATCLILPTALGFLLRFYDDPSWWQRKLVLPDDSWSFFFYDQTAYYLCPAVTAGGASAADGSANADFSITRTIAFYLGMDASYLDETGRWWWCPEPVETDVRSRLANVLSPDAGWTDFGIVAIFSLTLAVIRLSIVNRLVHPLTGDGSSVKLEALVRCKSIHLLGSEYQESLTPRGTPRSSIHLVGDYQQGENVDVSSIMIPALSTNNTNTNNMSSMSMAIGRVPSEHDLGLGLDESDHNHGVALSQQEQISSSPFLSQGGLSTPPRRPSTGAVNIDGDVDMEQVDSFQRLSQLDAATRQGGAFAEMPSEPSPQPSPRSSPDRLYAAPRYATAVFRLMYCTATTSLAWYWFRDANFWPWYVGGHGSTNKCWDLSGGLTLGVDSDFDQRNAVLRRYFLWQASYHWHSGAFHLISMMILLFHPKHHAKRRFLSVKTTTSAYVRSLVQHLFSLALIATVYVFSSLRRLAAIGMFAFDVSSWFLHLLQICMNAPESSRWKQRATVSRIYKGLVIPSFVITRFLMWPCVWYSLEVESKAWLVQLENMLVPGSAFAMRCTFHFWMILLMGSTVVYFRRLLDHPHLQRILRQSGEFK